jgi:hypothetical protein
MKARASVKKACEEIELKPRDLPICIADSVQWKQYFTHDAGTYNHWTVIAYRVITENQPIKDGIYSDSNPQIQQLSRKCTYWLEEVIEKNSPDEILGKTFHPQQGDFSALCDLVFALIGCTLKMNVSEILLNYTIKTVPLLHRTFTIADGMLTI